MGSRGDTEGVRNIGGLVAVAVGIGAVATVAIVAIIVGGSTASTIASSTGGVIASIVGAYFGVKLGNDNSRRAAESERKQAAKAAVFAAHLPENVADRVLAQAEETTRDVPPAA
jgi:hypothetical protein